MENDVRHMSTSAALVCKNSAHQIRYDCMTSFHLDFADNSSNFHLYVADVSVFIDIHQ